MKKFLFFLLFLIPTNLYSAEGTLKKDFEVNTSYDKTLKWVEENQKLIRKTMGLEVLQDLGNGKLKVKKETSKGTFIWILQEKIEKKDNLYKYKSNLIQSIEGGMLASDTEIIIKPIKNKTNIIMKVGAKIQENNEIGDFEIRFDINMHTNKVKKLLEHQFK